MSVSDGSESKEPIYARTIWMGRDPPIYYNVAKGSMNFIYPVDQIKSIIYLIQKLL